MKQGRFYTTLILWIFLAAVVCYFGYAVFNTIYAPLTTVTAIEYEAGTGSYTTGYVVRDESIIRSSYGITSLLVSEGERVARGQAVATGYRDESAQARQAELEQLEQQLQQLTYASSYSADAADQAVLDSEISTRLTEMSRYLARGDLNSLSDGSAALKGLILRRMSSEAENQALDQQIEALRAQIEALQADASYDTTVVAAGKSGYFSGAVDGYESVLTVDRLSTITAAELEAIQPVDPPEDAVGRLIAGNTWYYVTTVPVSQLEGVETGDTVPVTFASQFYDSIPMTVERLGQEQSGNRILVLSCDRYLQSVTLLRQQSADVVFSSYAGLRVPKEAIRVNEAGQAGVYILEGSNAVWKTVNILHDNGESYVVELDKSSVNHLWPGDDIIVTGRDLYDGKVVR